MDINFKELNEEVNRLASELVAHDPADINKGDVKQIQNDIAVRLISAYGKMPEKTDKYGNQIRFFWLIKKNMPEQVFNFTLGKLLGLNKSGQWYFDPSRASFITLFKKQLEYDLLDYFNEMEQKTDKDEGEDLGEIPAPDSENLFDNSLRGLFGLAYILDVYANKIMKSSSKEKKYFEALFTFDTTRAVKSNDENAETACRYTRDIFPYMVISLLDFLMKCIKEKFTEMRDVVLSPLREGVDMKKRGELLENYLKVSHPTENKYSQIYDELKRSICGMI